MIILQCFESSDPVKSELLKGKKELKRGKQTKKLRTLDVSVGSSELHWRFVVKVARVARNVETKQHLKWNKIRRKNYEVEKLVSVTVQSVNDLNRLREN